MNKLKGENINICKCISLNINFLKYNGLHGHETLYI
jgi:hypothetical protein